jgi:transposase
LRSIASRGGRTPLCFWTRAGVASASRRLCCWTTIRFATGVGLLSEAGSKRLKSFGHEGGSSRLTDEQAIAVADWVDAHRPRRIRKIGAWLRRTFALSYSRSGLIALLHRLGFDYRKPQAMPRGLDDAEQQAFIDRYENLLNTMGLDGPSPLSMGSI